MNPRYQHDCSACTFLGHFAGYDLYFCPQGGFSPTVLARFSNEGPDYTSGMGSAHPALIEAEIRFLEAQYSQVKA